MGITWTHTGTNPDGTEKWEYIDDATGKPYDMQAAKDVALSYTPGGGGYGYSMADYERAQYNQRKKDDPNYYDSKYDASPTVLSEEQQKQWDKEQEARTKATEEAQQKQKQDAQAAWRAAYRDMLKTVPFEPNKRTGPNLKKWGWKV